MDKLHKGTLKDYYSRQKYTDELSNTCYYVDKNLEKQVVSLMKNFCLHDNNEMQDYVREQSNNTKSYNMVEIITDYASKFLNSLQYPVAYDTFNRTLECILEFNHGPNIHNQEIVIQHGFINLANEILKMDYKNSQDTDEKAYNKADFTNSRLVSSVKNKLKSFGPSVSSFTKGFSTREKNEINSDDVRQPQTNFMISLIKYNILLVLSQLLVGRKETSYVYYSLRRIIDPDVFRKNFAYQHFFIKRFHKNEYTLKMFFRYNKNVDKKTNSPLIMEIGFQLYFLLLQMTNNFAIDPDEKYENHLLQLMNFEKKKASVQNKWLLVDIYSFAKKFFQLCLYYIRRKEKEISITEVDKIAQNNNVMKNILRFYSLNVSQIEIFKDGKSYLQFFPLLPYCKFSSEEILEKFNEEVDRTNSKTKCEYLMRKADFFILDMKVNYWLKKGLTRFVGLLQEHFDTIKEVNAYICLIINIIILSSYTTTTGGRTDNPRLSNTSVAFTEGLLLALGIMSVLLL